MITAVSQYLLFIKVVKSVPAVDPTVLTQLEKMWQAIPARYQTQGFVAGRPKKNKKAPAPSEGFSSFDWTIYMVAFLWVCIALCLIIFLCVLYQVEAGKKIPCGHLRTQLGLTELYRDQSNWGRKIRSWFGSENIHGGAGTTLTIK